MKRDFASVSSLLYASGALSLKTLAWLGYRQADVLRWVREGKLYHPYSKRDDVVMVER